MKNSIVSIRRLTVILGILLSSKFVWAGKGKYTWPTGGISYSPQSSSKPVSCLVGRGDGINGAAGKPCNAPEFSRLAKNKKVRAPNACMFVGGLWKHGILQTRGDGSFDFTPKETCTYGIQVLSLNDGVFLYGPSLGLNRNYCNSLAPDQAEKRCANKHKDERNAGLWWKVQAERTDLSENIAILNSLMAGAEPKAPKEQGHIPIQCALSEGRNGAAGGLTDCNQDQMAKNFCALVRVSANPAIKGDYKLSKASSRRLKYFAGKGWSGWWWVQFARKNMREPQICMGGVQLVARGEFGDGIDLAVEEDGTTNPNKFKNLKIKDGTDENKLCDEVPDCKPWVAQCKVGGTFLNCANECQDGDQCSQIKVNMGSLADRQRNPKLDGLKKKSCFYMAGQWYYHKGFGGKRHRWRNLDKNKEACGKIIVRADSLSEGKGDDDLDSNLLADAGIKVIEQNDQTTDGDEIELTIGKHFGMSQTGIGSSKKISTRIGEPTCKEVDCGPTAQRSVANKNGDSLEVNSAQGKTVRRKLEVEDDDFLKVDKDGNLTVKKIKATGP